MAFPVDNFSFKKAEVAGSHVRAAEFLDTVSDHSNQPLGGGAGISSLPQCEVQFGLYSLPSRSRMKVSRKIKRLTVKLSMGLGSVQSCAWWWEGIRMWDRLHRGASAASEPSRDLMKVERNSFHVYSNC